MSVNLGSAHAQITLNPSQFVRAARLAKQAALGIGHGIGRAGVQATRESNKIVRTLRTLGTRIKGIFRRGATDVGGMTNALGMLNAKSVFVGQMMQQAFFMATRALKGLIKGTIGGAIEMEQQVADLASIWNTTSEQIRPAKELIEELAIDPQLRVTAAEAADAVKMLARNGVEMKDVLDGAARSTILLANATGGNFKTSADIMTDAMAQFEGKLSSYSDTVDRLVAITTNSKFDIEAVQFALGNAGGVASTVGVEFNDLATTLGVVARMFKSGRDAGTSIKTFLLRLVPSSEKAREAMNMLGLEFFTTEGKLKSMSEIAGELNEAFFGTRTVMTEVGGRTAEQNRQLGMLQAAYAKTLESIDKYNLGINGASLGEEERAEKVAELQGQLGSYEEQMAALLAIQGEMVATNKQLTEAEINEYMKTIFGTDGIRVATAMAEGGAEAFDAMASAMDQVDASRAALERMDTVSGVFDILQGLLEGYGLAIGNQFLPAVRKMGDAFIVFLDRAGPNIVTVFESMGSALSTMLALFLDGDAPISFIARALNRIVNGADATNIEFAKMVVKAETLWSKLTGLTSSFREMIDGLFEAKDFLIGFGVALAVVFGPGLLGILGAVAAALWPIVAITGAVAVAIAVLRRAWKTNFADIQGASERAMRGVGIMFEGILAIIDGDWETGLQKIKDGWKFTWIVVKDFLRDAWREIKETMGPILNDIWVAIQEWFNSVDWKGLWDKLWEIDEQIKDKIWDAVRPILVRLWEEMKTWFNANIANPWSDWFEGVKEYLTTRSWGEIGSDILAAMWDISWSIAEFLQGLIWDPFVEWVGKQDWESIAETLTTRIILGLNGFDPEADKVRKHWYNKFWDWAKEADWETVVDTIHQAWIDVMYTFPMWIAEVLSSWYDAFLQWAMTASWDTVSRTIVEAIVDGLMSGPNWGQVGIDIIKGITSGVENAASTLASAARNAAMKAVNEAAAAAKGAKPPASSGSGGGGAPGSNSSGGGSSSGSSGRAPSGGGGGQGGFTAFDALMQPQMANMALTGMTGSMSPTPAGDTPAGGEPQAGATNIYIDARQASSPQMVEKSVEKALKKAGVRADRISRTGYAAVSR